MFNAPKEKTCSLTLLVHTARAHLAQPAALPSFMQKLCFVWLLNISLFNLIHLAQSWYPSKMKILCVLAPMRYCSLFHFTHCPAVGAGYWMYRRRWQSCFRLSTSSQLSPPDRHALEEQRVSRARHLLLLACLCGLIYLLAIKMPAL